MARANSFVKNELQETLEAYTPTDGIYNVLDPCALCEKYKTKGTTKRWEYCMRERRRCFRKGEVHPLPTIRRVHVDNLSEERDFACVFENDGGQTITWDKRTTRCRVPCDRCWSLAQCTRMKHALDPCDIPFLDIDDAPGVTPAKRSCKSASPLGCAKTPGSGGGSKESKQARRSPSSSPATGPQADAVPKPPATLATPSPPPLSRLPAVPMPAVTAADVGSAVVPPRSSPPSSGGGRASGSVSVSGSGGGGSSNGGNARPRSAAAIGRGGGDKGKRPARRHSRGADVGETGVVGVGVGNDPRSPSPDAAAGAGVGAAGSGRGGTGRAEAGSGGGGGAGVGRAGTRVHFPEAGRGSDVYIDTLRERVQSAASEVQKAVKHLSELDKVKLHASAQIRDGERLLKSTKLKEQQVQKLVDEFKSKEAELTNQLKAALAQTAAKLQQEAAQLEREAQLLP